ncbi:MAG: hypothetical protein ACRDP7_40230 [Trebonia sp.]
MRRAKLALLLPVVPLLALVAPGAAQAATADNHAATVADQPAATYTCYPNTSESFNVAYPDLVDKQVTTNLPDGTPIPGGFVAHSDPGFDANVTTGLLIQQFTNETTGKTIVRNVSAPSWFTYDPTPTVPGALATGTYVTTGSNAQLFGPMSLAALSAAGIHEPTFVLESGLLVMHFVVVSTGPYVSSFSLHGKQQNGCALLAG